MKVKASSNFCRVPSQTNLQRRRSMSGLKTSANSDRAFGVQAVGGDDEVITLHVGRRSLDLRFESQVDAQFPRPLLQQQQQLLAPDSAETVTARDRTRSLVNDRDVVPVGKVGPDRFGADGIVVGEVCKGFVRQHHPPTEGVVGTVALDHDDLVVRIPQFHRDREVERSRSTAQASYTHRLASSHARRR